MKKLTDKQYIEIGKDAAKFFTTWWPDNWLKDDTFEYKNSPGYKEAREIRLKIQRMKKAAK